MFQFIEGLSKEPLRAFAMPGVYFEPGNVVELKEFGGMLVADLSQGAKPLGLCGNSMFVEEPTFDEIFMIEIHLHRMVFRTDNYEGNDYRTGKLLYTNSNGILTTEAPFEDALYLGRVISVFDKGIIEAIWL